MKMKVVNFLWLVFCLAPSLSAQKGIVSSGGDIISPNGSVAYSVGQIAYVPIDGEKGNLNPGVQQPLHSGLVALHDVHWDDLLKLYPNPANQLLYLQLSAETGMLHEQGLQARVFDVNGNLLISQRLMDAVNSIKISGLPEALYFIQIWQSNQFIQSISFSKTN